MSQTKEKPEKDKKVRVFALAKELNLDSKVLVDLCKDLGFSGITNQLNGLEPGQVDALRERVKKGLNKPAAAPPSAAPPKPGLPPTAKLENKIVTLPKAKPAPRPAAEPPPPPAAEPPAPAAAEPAAAAEPEAAAPPAAPEPPAVVAEAPPAPAAPAVTPPPAPTPPANVIPNLAGRGMPNLGGGVRNLNAPRPTAPPPPKSNPPAPAPAVPAAAPPAADGPAAAPATVAGPGP
ncbi:MAG: hypothetical protein C0501_25460, partial [Isosphaera sp.]|nr:hypothetical protein [Isosphaera sp.]